MKLMIPLILMLSAFISQISHASPMFAGEDGYRLWLKYDLIHDPIKRRHYKKQLARIHLQGHSDTMAAIRQELNTALPQLLAKPVKFVAKAKRANNLVIAKGSQAIQKRYKLDARFAKLTHDGFLIKVLNTHHGRQTLITAKSDIGLLYGTFRLIQLLQTGEDIRHIHLAESPKINIRMLDHWDDLDRHTERGYAGQSIWDWHKLPEYKKQRYYDYARANASIGINGVAVNNVNADSLILTPTWLKKVSALADIFRPYGIKVYVSVKFSSPQQIGDLKTSDPNNQAVQMWWQKKAKEIYQTIPNFGGFLVKANSEGQPGPGDYGRTHAEGANMLAKALKPYGGNVIWRAFVYSHEENTERSLQAYNEFVPLDGQFADNVSVQVKNGPIDFQPREPFSPLFGAMPKTSLAMEFQITQEYLGFSTHLAYLAPLFKETLDTDTYKYGKGSTVAKIIDGSYYKAGKPHLTVMAGVANIGMDRNWTGHIFGQANWYAFGRLAWNHQLSSQKIAADWAKMTLTTDPKAVHNIVSIMMGSRETIVNYMTPLGLHHIMGSDHHYGPAPWVDNLGRADWNPVYYHRADQQGIGLNRTASGTNAVSQYAKHWRVIFSDPKKTPEKLLLWFHHLPWDYKMASGDTLWNELVKHYYHGVDEVIAMQKEWLALKGQIDNNQFNQVRMALAIQVKEAKWWRDACVLYFQTFSHRPLPEGLKAPEKTLEYYQSLTFPYAPGQG
ncbi:MAG: alpha-glucuronidase family glycosyl hydrolase [Vibrio sp.]